MASLPPGITVAAAIMQLSAWFKQVGLDSPAVDARLLTGAALAATAEDLIRDPARVLSATERETLDGFAARRGQHEPVSRILGWRGFYGRMFEVTPDTLDPRPDTETLIEAALEIVRERNWQDQPIRILDVGTGTGCILITLLSELPKATGIGIDISHSALNTAIRNANSNGVSDRTQFIVGDSLNGQSEPFDLIVSNPPYIPAATIAALDPDVRDYDPLIALDGGADGLDVYRAIANVLQNVLHDGAIVVEVGVGQALEVAQLFTEALGSRALRPRFWVDLGGHQRCVAVATHGPSPLPKNL